MGFWVSTDEIFTVPPCNQENLSCTGCLVHGVNRFYHKNISYRLAMFYMSVLVLGNIPEIPVY